MPHWNSSQREIDAHCLEVLLCGMGRFVVEQKLIPVIKTRSSHYGNWRESYDAGYYRLIVAESPSTTIRLLVFSSRQIIVEASGSGTESLPGDYAFPDIHERLVEWDREVPRPPKVVRELLIF